MPQCFEPKTEILPKPQQEIWPLLAPGSRGFPSSCTGERQSRSISDIADRWTSISSGPNRSTRKSSQPRSDSCAMLKRFRKTKTRLS